MHDQASPGRSRHLVAVRPGAQPSPAEPDNRPVLYTLSARAEALLAATEPTIRPARPTRVTLALWPRQTAEDARQLLYRLAETSAADLTPGQLAFTLGLLHGAGMNLLDIIDAITEP